VSYKTQNTIHSSMENCSVVDIFCGVGGLTHGFVKEGFDVIGGIDADDSCEYAFEHNNNSTFYHARVENVGAEEIRALYADSAGSKRIMVGCAPCQPYSSYTDKDKKEIDGKWALLDEFSRLIGETKPDVVAMENVPRLESFKDGAVFQRFVESLREVGYSEPEGSLTYRNVYCPNYGVPQTRRRLVLLASLSGKIDLIEPTHDPDKQTVRNAINDVEPLDHGEAAQFDPVHKASQLSDLNLRRIRSSVPGGTWEDWDEELLADCHKRASGKSYQSVYGRMEWDKPGPTITTQFYGYGKGRFGHPEQDRALSLREGALLQTFPKDYEFVRPGDPVYFKHMGKYIGNAVPVNLGRAIAKSIKRHFR